jgi:hypothetical protein
MSHKRHHEPEEPHSEAHDLHSIAESLRHLVSIQLHLHAAVGFEVFQISGGTDMAKTRFGASFPGPVVGVPAGGTGSFGLAPIGADGNPGLLQSGNVPVITVDDTANVTLTPSADGSSVSCAVAAGDTNTSFNLTVSGVNSLGVAISSVFNIPVLAAAPPPEQAATAFSIQQLS